MNSKAIRKQLLAAVAMVLVAAVALGSSTYAWFAANNEVTAEGMSLKAQGESGMVIKYAGADNTVPWATVASANMTQATGLRPTSTMNLSDWVHAVSTEMDDAQAAQNAGKYEPLTNTAGYVLMQSFYIRSAAQSVPISNVKLAVKEVAVTSTTSTSESLDKAVRVGVKVGSTFYVYAPLADNDFVLNATYDAAEETLTEKKAASATTDLFTLSNNQIPINDTELQADIYMWFEGEDENCKSKNITASLDNLSVTVKFTSVPISS